MIQDLKPRIIKAIVLSVEKIKISDQPEGGYYMRCVFKDISKGSSGEQFTFDCWEKIESSNKFWPYLEPQAMFDNIKVIPWNCKGGKRLVISGYSNFKYLGVKNK